MLLFNELLEMYNFKISVPETKSKSDIPSVLKQKKLFCHRQNAIVQWITKDVQFQNFSARNKIQIMQIWYYTKCAKISTLQIIIVTGKMLKVRTIVAKWINF